MALTYHAGRRIQGSTYPVSYWDFDGTNDYVQMPTIPTGYTFAVSMWVRKDTSGRQAFMVDNDTNGIWLEDADAGSTRLRVGHSQSGSDFDTSTGFPVDSNFHHLVFNVGTPNQIWLDGVSLGTGGSANSTSTNWIPAMGARNTSGTIDRFLNGAMSKVGIWDRKLTDAEVESLYAEAEPSSISSGLLATYDFEQTGSTLEDQTNSYDGTNNGATTGGTRDAQDAKPTDVQVGSRYEETNTRKIYSRMDSDYVTDKWFELGTVPYAGGRAVFGGGINTGSSAVDTIDYITIATLGNADTFGDLSQARYGLGAMANKTRTLFAGGNTGGGNQTTIDFITPATLGDATTFGNISNDTSKTYGVMCLSSETRGIIAGGESGYSNRIDYVTIDTEGNSTSFPDGSGGITTLTVAGKQGATTSDGTRGVFMGGEGRTPTMDYITIDTAGVCTDFGDLRETLYGGSHGLATDGTIGVFTTGNSYSSNVEKITIQTLGNSTNFGNMDTGRSNLGLASDKTRAIFAGGKTASGNNYTNTIEHSAIPTPSGNASDFGDLQVARQVLAGASDIGADRS